MPATSAGHDETEDLDCVRSARQEFLDLHRDAVPADDHGPFRHGHVVGENTDLVLFGGIEFDDGAAAEPQDLVDRHRGFAQDHCDID